MDAQQAAIYLSIGVNRLAALLTERDTSDTERWRGELVQLVEALEAIRGDQSIVTSFVVTDSVVKDARAVLGVCRSGMTPDELNAISDTLRRVCVALGVDPDAAVGPRA